MVETNLPGTSELPWLVPGDYEDALIHLAWHVNMEDGRRTLLYGMVELFPPELPALNAVREDRHSLRVRRAGGSRRNDRLCVERFRVSLEQALRWYEACRAGDVRFPVDGNVTAAETTLEHEQFFEEPRWPLLVTTQDALCLSASWGTVRAHHLFQRHEPRVVDVIRRHKSALEWLSERLFFDIANYTEDEAVEWAGSVRLIAPNPLYRELDCRHELSDHGRESCAVRIVARAGAVLDGLRFSLVEYGVAGITAMHTMEVTSPDFAIEHVNPMPAISYTLSCPRRGVLDWLERSQYLGGITIQQAMTTVPEQVPVPAIRNRPSETYPRTVVAAETEVNIRDPLASPAGTMELFRARQTRLERQRAEERVEKLFFDEQDEATSFVRGLVANARSQVQIIDRYFDAVEFLRYAVSVARRQVPITIISSAKFLRDEDPDHLGRSRAMVLRDTIDSQRSPGQLSVLVMPGDPPIIHDRFLVVDGNVWVAGSSYYSLGQLASTLIKLVHPREAIDWLADIVRHHDFRPLDEWIRDHPFTPAPLATEGPSTTTSDVATGTTSTEEATPGPAAHLEATMSGSTELQPDESG
jgi:hypothetical protein